MHLNGSAILFLKNPPLKELFSWVNGSTIAKEKFVMFAYTHTHMHKTYEIENYQRKHSTAFISLIGALRLSGFMFASTILQLLFFDNFGI